MFLVATITFVMALILTAIYWADVGVLLLLSLAVCFSGVCLVVAWSYYQVTTEQGYGLLMESRFPDMPMRGHYAEGLVARGLFSEVVWGFQVLVALAGLLGGCSFCFNCI